MFVLIGIWNNDMNWRVKLNYKINLELNDWNREGECMCESFFKKKKGGKGCLLMKEKHLECLGNCCR